MPRGVLVDVPCSDASVPTAGGPSPRSVLRARIPYFVTRGTGEAQSGAGTTWPLLADFRKAKAYRDRLREECARAEREARAASRQEREVLQEEADLHAAITAQDHELREMQAALQRLHANRQRQLADDHVALAAYHREQLHKYGIAVPPPQPAVSSHSATSVSHTQSTQPSVPPAMTPPAHTSAVASSAVASSAAIDSSAVPAPAARQRLRQSTAPVGSGDEQWSPFNTAVPPSVPPSSHRLCTAMSREGEAGGPSPFPSMPCYQVPHATPTTFGQAVLGGGPGLVERVPEPPVSGRAESSAPALIPHRSSVRFCPNVSVSQAVLYSQTSPEASTVQWPDRLTSVATSAAGMQRPPPPSAMTTEQPPGQSRGMDESLHVLMSNVQSEVCSSNSESSTTPPPGASQVPFESVFTSAPPPCRPEDVVPETFSPAPL